MPRIAKNFFKGKMTIWNGVTVTLFEDPRDKIPQPPPPIELPLLLKQQRYRVKLLSVNTMEDIVLEFTNGDIVNCSVYNAACAEETHEDRLRVLIGTPVIAYFHGIVEGDTNKLLVTLYDVDGFRIPIIEPRGDAPESIHPLCPARILRSKIAGYVSNVEGTSIYLQPSDFDKEFEKLKQDLKEYYVGCSAGRAERKVGTPAIYVSESRECYRAVTRSVQDEDTTLYFVDFGGTARVLRGYVQEMALDFVDLCEYCLKIDVGRHAQSFYNRFVKGTIRCGSNGWEGSFCIDEPYAKDHLSNFEDPRRTANVILNEYRIGRSKEVAFASTSSGTVRTSLVTKDPDSKDPDTEENVELTKKPEKGTVEEG